MSENPLVPWDVRPAHTGSHLLAMLHHEHRRRQGLPATADVPSETVLEWTERLRSRGAVVDYRPRVRGGFFLVHARPGIDTDLIRVPDPGPGQ